MLRDTIDGTKFLLKFVNMQYLCHYIFVISVCKMCHSKMPCLHACTLKSRTEKGPWSPEIELNWSNTTKREDLLAVRDYFKKPMRIDVSSCQF